MTERGEKLSDKLAKVRKNIEDTKRLVAYHKKMLKIYIRKEAEIKDKLEKEQFNDLYKAVRDNGCDIAAINTAINNGEFSAESEAAEAASEDNGNGKAYNAETRNDKREENKI